MKFGKLENVDGINFTLPDDSAFTNHLFSELTEAKRKRLYLGCTMWGMNEWKGTYYPQKAKPADFLYHYSRQFQSIELNTTHYRIPSTEQVEKWCAAVPSDFRFCPKVPQIISHSKDLGVNHERFDWWLRAIDDFGGKHGCTFMQLPTHFLPNKLTLLEEFLIKWPKSKQLAIEVRHSELFSGEAHDELAALLSAHNVATVLSDTAGRRDAAHMTLTKPEIVIRWVGNNHQSDEKRVEDWASKLNTWFNNGLESVYFFIHQPTQLSVPPIADYLAQHLDKSIEIQLPKKIEPLSNQATLF